MANEPAVKSNLINLETGRSTVDFSYGTSVFSGIFREEYLTKLQGRKAMDIWDQMRRSDPQVAMIVGAVVNTLRSATYTIQPWTQDPEDDGYDNAQLHAEFASFNIFEDLSTPWSSLLNEIYTYPIFGFAPFVMVDKHVQGHPKWGNYSGLENLTYVSQKTIDEWKLTDQGKLISIRQNAFGDLGKFVDIPSEFLAVFTNQKEGANYEGISMLRPAYGPWWRKNQYIKIEAIGSERSTLGIPIVTVPAGKEQDENRARFESLMEKLAAHQLQWVMIPEGWTLAMHKLDFSAQTLRATIAAEDESMARSILANFLNLGQGGSGGAYALSADLSDFFIAGNQALAKVVAEVFNSIIIPRLIKMQYGPQPVYPFMSVSGLAEKAGKEFAEIVQILKSSGALGVWSKKDVAQLRERINWVEEDEDDPAGGQPAPAPAFGAVPPKPAPEPKEENDDDTKLDRRTKLDTRIQFSKPRKLMDDGAESLQDVMRSNLRFIGEKLVADLVNQWEKLPDSHKPKAVTKVSAGGLVKYTQDLRNAFVNLSTKALNQVKDENPKIDTTKFSIKFADPAKIAGKFKKRDYLMLPKFVRTAIDAQAKLIVQAQAADMQKAVFFKFGNIQPTTDSASLITSELNKSVDGMLVNTATAANLSAANLVNQTRHGFFFEPEVEKQIESFTFTNEDPVTDICRSLNGKVFRKDDAESLLYEPPLHYNCKSYLVANHIDSGVFEKTPKGERGIVPSKSLMPQVTLAEEPIAAAFKEGFKFIKGNSICHSHR